MKKKLFYLLLVGAIFSLSSCGESHTCSWCGETYFGEGYAKAFNVCAKSEIGIFCSEKCCFHR